MLLEVVIVLENPCVLAFPVLDPIVLAEDFIILIGFKFVSSHLLCASLVVAMWAWAA